MTNTLLTPGTATALETARLLPPGFELGVAMASYQLEGALSVAWASPGAVVEGELRVVPRAHCRPWGLSLVDRSRP
jgi:hypothetical protein